MMVYLEIFFVLASGYVLVLGYLSLNDGDFKHLGLAGLLLLFLYFPVIASYSSKLDWHLEDRAMWMLYKEHIEWLAIGGIIGTLYTLFDDEYISNFFAKGKSSQIPTSKNKIKVMGSSPSNFDDKSLDIQSITIVKLVYFAFGHLDRQVSASVEANLDIRPNQQKNVQRLLTEVIDQKPTILEALSPLKSMEQGRHNASYSIFNKLCLIAVHSQRYGQTTLKNLTSIAQQLGLSQEEIDYLFQKARLVL